MELQSVVSSDPVRYEAVEGGQDNEMDQEALQQELHWSVEEAQECRGVDQKGFSLSE